LRFINHFCPALKEAQKAIDKGVRHKVKQLLKEIKTGLKV